MAIVGYRALKQRSEAVAQSNEARAAVVVAAMHDAARYDDYQRFEPIPIYRTAD